MSEEIDLFVPGRICLFGEHSDWAGGYRRVNADLEKGYTIIAGTNQGLYARVKQAEDRIVFKTISGNGEDSRMDLPLNPAALLAVAEKGGFWSYVAGTAYQILTHHRVKGIEIENYRNDLPQKKGLSSSAAVCVLVARAFNRVYDLKMTTRGEMEVAYRGEITTPSRCGRMDQGCAYGNRPILMTYDGDNLEVEELTVGCDLHYLIVDLRAKKDTVRILRDLNHSYPFAEDAVGKSVQEYLGHQNKQILLEARNALQAGDSEKLGRLMTRAQEEFDAHLAPACPAELTAPVLHSLLQNPLVAPLVYGGKGVGSQGDGTAQFLARGVDEQRELVRIIETRLGMSCLPLTIRRAKRVRKAVVTAAGPDANFYPMSLVLRRELMPVKNEHGILVPLIVKQVEDLFEAGIEEVGIVIHPRERMQFERLFRDPIDPEQYQSLPSPQKEFCDHLAELGRHVQFIEQGRSRGLGSAILAAAEFVGTQPVVLVLGDHLFFSTIEPCTQQLLKAFDQYQCNIVGVFLGNDDIAERGGVVRVSWEVPLKNGMVEEIAEKPTRNYAQDFLRTEGLSDRHYLCVFGQYIILPQVVDSLKGMKSSGMLDENSFTKALEISRSTGSLKAIVMDASRDDPVLVGCSLS